MRTIAQDYKFITAVPAQAITATLTGGAISVQPYDTDAAAIVNLGTFTSNPTVTVTVVGALVATPTTYNQTLATFNAATAAGLAVAQLNLSGMANIKFVYTMAGGTTPSVPVNGVLAIKPFLKSAVNNSLTFA